MNRLQGTISGILAAGFIGFLTFGNTACAGPMIKEYLVDNFHLSAANLRTIGYGKTRPKNKMDPNASENRRVEVVNLAPQATAAR
jgi:hypothetical protein